MCATQKYVTIVCFLLLSQNTFAVVNNALNTNVEETSSGGTSASTDAKTEAVEPAASASEKDSTRREAPIALGDTYGAPIPSGGGVGINFDNSYLPPPKDNNLPVPVYGVPDAPTNNIVYPSLPPDIPPALPDASFQFGGLGLLNPAPTYGPPKPVYGPPKDTYGPPKDTYGPPKPIFGPPKNTYGPPKDTYGLPPKLFSPAGLPPLKYGAPIRPHKPINSIPLHIKHSKNHYGPPPQYNIPFKPNFKIPKPQLGHGHGHGHGHGIGLGPKPFYGPPPKHFPKPHSTYGLPVNDLSFSSPFLSKYNVPPIKDFPITGFKKPALVEAHTHYGPPDPVPSGPPHPGAPAPPTPPDIKYDGWQPIPGLISRPPSDSYAAIENHHHHHQGGQQGQLLDVAFVPPIAGGNLPLGPSSHENQGKYAGLSDSYGAPLNIVTGSGNVISTSGDDHSHNNDLSAGLSSLGLNSQDTSVVKSIGYEINLNGNGHLDTYGAPPLNSYSPSGPYPAAQPHKHIGSFSSSSLFGGSSFNSHAFQHSDIGLIPPSGQYGVPPSGSYGTPLLTPPRHGFSSFKPPKHPVVFREPVPQGLLQSIGDNVAHKDAHGIIDSHGSSFSGNAYIPPPVGDLAKPPPPTNLFSLPNTHNPVSFQNVVHGSSSLGLSSFSTLNTDTNSVFNAQAAALTSYNAPQFTTLGHGYNFQSQGGGLTVGLEQSPPISIDLVNSLGGGISHGNSFGIPHDCPHKAPIQPHITYGVPIVDNQLGLSNSYGVPDLHTAHSENTATRASGNAIDEVPSKIPHAKFLDTTGGELIKSQSVDFNNIPLEGALGSYTLQISPADGLGVTNGSTHIPHDQVLNNGLLQSILAAIEQQPQQQQQNIFGQQLFQAQPQFFVNPAALETKPQEFPVDGDTQHSIIKEVVVAPPQNTVQDSTTASVLDENENSVELIDKNDIAIYFNNTADATPTTTSNKDAQSQKLDSEVRNGQQYGSYVSVETPTSSFSYGDGSLAPDSEKTKKQ